MNRKQKKQKRLNAKAHTKHQNTPKITPQKQSVLAAYDQVRLREQHDFEITSRAHAEACLSRCDEFGRAVHQIAERKTKSKLVKLLIAVLIGVVALWWIV